MSDFEIAIGLAASQVYEGIKIIKCLFHFSQVSHLNCINFFLNMMLYSILNNKYYNICILHIVCQNNTFYYGELYNNY